MDLKGRKLSVRMRGEDVALLHGALGQLKFTIPNDELQKKFFGKATQKAVLDFQKKHGLEPTGLVDEETAKLIVRELEEQSPERDFEVKGTVRHPNGRPFVGGLVRAFDKDLRSEQLLGKTATDDEGHYEIKYSPDQFRRAEKKSADLLMRVYSVKGETLYEPRLEEVHFNAPRVTVIDIQLKIGDRHGESEYERLLRSIQPLLEKVPIRELREDEEVQDITFLHRETDWSVDRLEHVVMAHRLSVLSEIRPEFYYALLRENTLLKVDIAATFQVRFRIDLQTEPKSLFYEVVSLAPEVIRRAVKQAIQHESVPQKLANQLDNILKKLAQRADEARAYRQNEQPRKIFNLIEKNLVAGKVAEALEIIGQDSNGDITQLIDRLSKASAVLSHEDSMEAETSLRLGEVLAFDEDIISSVKESQGIRKPEDVRNLAALNASGWKRVLTKSAAKIKAGGTPVKTDLIGLHASSLVRKMEKRFPTMAFAAQLERDKKSKLPHRKAMSQLFEKHPDFDLATTNIDVFFKRSEVTSLAGEDGAGMKESLKAVQRVFKLAPTYRKTNALMQAGISSAYSIYAMGQTQFLKRFAGTGGTFSQSEARVIYQKASDIHTASLMLAADMKSTVSASMIHSLGDLVSPDKLETVTKDFPNLKSLFQLTDLCQCEHCRSVYSPAAYLVDALQFLKKRLVVDTTAAAPLSIKIAKDVLFDRRPDIGDLDLSCPNTDTPLPYIDIVCELLEEVVKPDPGIPYSGTIVSGPIPVTLLTLLQARGYPFTNQAMLSELNGSYILRDKAVVCKVTPDGAGGWIIKRLRQTHLSAEELSAAPEYLNEDAYYELRKAKYAFGLPFDLYHQECKGYFEQFDIRRDHLMQASAREQP